LPDESVLSSFSEPENDAGVISKIALVIVAGSKAVAKSGQYKINLCWAYGDILCHGDIDTSTDDKIPRVIAGVVGANALQLASLLQVLVSIRVSAAKKRFHEGLEVRGAVFDDWSYVIGE